AGEELPDRLFVGSRNLLFELVQRELLCPQVARHELRHHEAAIEEGLECAAGARAQSHAGAPVAGLAFQQCEIARCFPNYRDHAIRHRVASVGIVIGPGKPLKRPLGGRLLDWFLAFLRCSCDFLSLESRAIRKEVPSRRRFTWALNAAFYREAAAVDN